MQRRKNDLELTALLAISLANEATEGTTTTESSTLDTVIREVVTWLSTHGVRLLIGLIALFITFKIANVIARSVKKNMEKRNVDKTIIRVTHSAVRWGLKLLLFIIFLGYVGIDTAGIGMAIGSVGVAIGLALQGALSNLAGGIIILINRPFKLDDYIEAQGEGGMVEDIRIFYTYLVTPDNKVIMIPNGQLANGNIVNYSKKDLRRVDLSFSIGYNEDFERAKAVILDICSANEMILKEPAPFVKVSSHSASSIDLVTRVWVKSGDYWSVHFQLLEDVKKRFDAEKISIPYPQMDVHMDRLEKTEKNAE